jgi:hypothetical protein
VSPWLAQYPRTVCATAHPGRFMTAIEPSSIIAA